MDVFGFLFDPFFTFLMFQYGFPVFCFIEFMFLALYVYIYRFAKPFSLFAKGMLAWVTWETGVCEPKLCSVKGNIVKYGKNSFGFLPQIIKDNDEFNLNKRFTIKGLNRPTFFIYASKCVTYTAEFLKMASYAKKQGSVLENKQDEALKRIDEIEKAGFKIEYDGKGYLKTPIGVADMEAQDLRDIRKLVDEAWPEELMEELDYWAKQEERESKVGGGKLGGLVIIVVGVAMIGLFIFLKFGGYI